MSKIERFEDIVAWQKGRSLVGSIYRVTDILPFARDYALRQQIRRAAISIPSNIAEGFERDRPREFHQFLSIARGSCAEVRTHLYLAHDVGHISAELFSELFKDAEEVARCIGGFRASLAKRHGLSTQHSALSTPKAALSTP